MLNDWVNHARKNVYSQHGEDGVIEAILERIGAENKWCVEFGAWDGITGSNTYRLITECGYKSILIEGDANKYRKLVKNMASYPAECLHRYVSFEGRNMLDSILAETEIPNDFSFLSIDIDGNDIHVWDSIKKYRPKLVVIEFNPTIANETEFVQPKDMSVNQGCSVLSLVKLGKEKGYELIATTLNNAFFVDQRYFDRFGIQNNSLCQLRTDLSRVTYIFNGYDGHVFIRGYGKLDLYAVPYAEHRMQLIPKFLQGWDVQNPVKRFLQRIHNSLRKRNII